jgi:hypothetical protein
VIKNWNSVSLSNLFVNLDIERQVLYLRGKGVGGTVREVVAGESTLPVSVKYKEKIILSCKRQKKARL